MDVPADADAGFTAVIASPLTAKESPLDLAPPGLTTVTVTAPGVASRLAGTVAVSEALLTKFVLRAVPPQ